MRQLPCPHCQEEIPDVGDAFCPYCHEELSPEHNPYVSEASDESEWRHFGPMPRGSIVVGQGESMWPGLCILCAASTDQFHRLRFFLKSETKKSLLKVLFGWNPLADLLVDEAFDERPVDFNLPVCELHLQDKRLSGVKGSAVEGRQVKIDGVHEEFVQASRKLHQGRWNDLAKKYDDR